ncbi:GNAT family N-acetyltransferase [Actinoallomurus sp. NBC_01490]|uniref:GNAT family N-acetyltransferase n=1 Tax=Actinoallomurus sp. NBC_01490 TaxID=2903557 RepID=UPI002E3543D0|nr:GNAT family N-acetyltransferase [Actinoallomurus sp. NBC_01490]
MPASVRPEVVELAGHEEHVAATRLLADIWGTTPESSPIPSDLLASIAHAGGCVLGAFTAGGDLAGVTVGVAGGPGVDSIYSLIAAVSSTEAGKGIGSALKFGQRDWALARSANRILWTFDPLIRRNAHFNLNKLGARVTEYIPDYYPPMHDAINRGDRPDRFYAEWRLDEAPPAQEIQDAEAATPPALEQGAHGAPSIPAFPASKTVRVWIPPDIEAMRRADADLALQWRLAARQVFEHAFTLGYRPTRLGSDGAYRLTRTGE